MNPSSTTETPLDATGTSPGEITLSDIDTVVRPLPGTAGEAPPVPLAPESPAAATVMDTADAAEATPTPTPGSGEPSSPRQTSTRRVSGALTPRSEEQRTASPEPTLSDVETLRRVPLVRRRAQRWLVRGIPLVVLCGLIAWSFARLRTPAGAKAPPPEILTPAPAPLALLEPTPTPTPEAPPAVDPGPQGLGVIEGKAIPDLLAVRVESLTGKKASTPPLGTVLRERTISLVNLWATWCRPCADELPHLREFFAANRLAGWGPQIQFVAVMVDDGATARAAFRKFGDRMPANTIFLIDRNLDGGVKAPLTAAELYSGELPVTLLFDCARRVRWHRIGALTRDDFTALAPLIETMRDEPACDKPPPPPPEAPPFLPVEASVVTEETAPDAGTLLAGVEQPVDLTSTRDSEESPPPGEEAPTEPATTKRPLSCGDGKCARDENCHTCDADCGCAEPERCMGRKFARCAIPRLRVDEEEEEEAVE